MAVKYFCDKCNDSNDKISFINTISYTFEKEYGGEITIKKDLCERCARRLEEWLKPDPQVMK
jgi:hypothetical protein